LSTTNEHSEVVCLTRRPSVVLCYPSQHFSEANKRRNVIDNSERNSGVQRTTGPI